MGMGMGLPPAKARDFRGSLRRLFGRLRPEAPLHRARRRPRRRQRRRSPILGPKILGDAVNLIFGGVDQRRVCRPASRSEQVVAGLRAQGQDQLADMLASHAADARPGHRLRRARRDPRRARRRLRPELGSSAGCRATSWPASPSGRSTGCARRSIASSAGCRSRYFDSHPRGDLLSRVTNDIDNIGQSLQQSLTQLITSLLTIVGVLVIDAHDQPDPGGRSRCSPCPSSLVATMRHRAPRRSSSSSPSGRRPARSTATSRRCTPGTRSSRRSVASARRSQTFDAENDRLYEASYRAQFISGIIQPTMTFISNLNYVAIAVIGGLRVASGQMTPGRCRGVHPVLAPVHVPDHPDGQHRQRPAVGGGVGGAGLRAARRGGGDRRGGDPGRARPGAGRRRLRGRLVPLRAGRAADRGPGPRASTRARRSPSSARPAPARRRWSTC